MFAIFANFSRRDPSPLSPKVAKERSAPKETLGLSKNRPQWQNWMSQNAISNLHLAHFQIDLRSQFATSNTL